jgi:MFS family permease
MSPQYEQTFAAMHGFVPLYDEPTSAHHQQHSRDLQFDQDDIIVQQFQRAKGFWWVFGALCIAEFIRAIDAASLPAILPSIVEDLNASTAQGYMSGSAFLLLQTVIQPVYAGVARATGNKICILVALSVFAGASALTGFAKTPYWMIGARAVRYFGAGECLNSADVVL